MVTNRISEEQLFDVLIIGAGPAGYMLATSLLAQGISNILIVDKRAQGVEAGQADGIQPRTIEIMHSYGLGDRLMREANRMAMAALYNPSPSSDGIVCTERLPDVHAPGARWPFELTLHQGGIEAIFRDRMAQQGVHVTFDTTVQSLKVDTDLAADHSQYVVQAQLEDATTKSPKHAVRARYVVGCDGAHSWVRQWLGFEMQGEQTDYIWGVMDGRPDTTFPDWRCKCAVHSRHGSCMVLPREDNKLRLYIQLAAAASEEDPSVTKSQRIDRTQFQLSDIQAAARKILAPHDIPFGEVHWWTIYVIGQRVASAYHDAQARVFIAGDACHTHSPKAGQGANAAMGDAHNLAWKLALSIKGQAKEPAKLLATYETERRKFAQDLIAFDRIFAALFSGKAAEGPSSGDAKGVSHKDFVEAFRAFGIFTSGIGIDYLSSPVDRIVAEMQANSNGTAKAAVTAAATQNSAKTNGHSSLPNDLLPSSSRLSTNSANMPHMSFHVGRRLPTASLVRAADGWTWQLHDVMPTNGSFRLLLWLGDVAPGTPGAQRAVKVAQHVEQLLKRFTPAGQKWDSVIDVLSIATTDFQTQFGSTLPSALRLFGARNGWEKVFSDCPALSTILGHLPSGTAYEDLGIDRETGAAIVVRPDGHVSVIASLDAISTEVSSFFDAVLAPVNSRAIEK